MLSRRQVTGSNREHINTILGDHHEANNDRSRVGQGDLRSHLGPPIQRWALEMKKEKNARAASLPKSFEGVRKCPLSGQAHKYSRVDNPVDHLDKPNMKRRQMNLEYQLHGPYIGSLCTQKFSQLRRQ
jgi:hypothetical protein